MSLSCPRVVLVGQPNVGKSQLFNLLTGSYTVVSNYPGTTVEITSGRGVLEGKGIEVTDTPGLYSLAALSPEEQVTRLLLFQERPGLVIQVADARNLSRMLPLTLELLEAGLPVVLVLNMMDEARASGVSVKSGLLSRRLGVPVVPAVLVSGRGLNNLRRAAAGALWGLDRQVPAGLAVRYPPAVEGALSTLAGRLRGRYGVSSRAAAQAFFNLDPALAGLMAKRGEEVPDLQSIARRVELGGDPLLLMASARRAAAASLLEGVVSRIISPGGSLWAGALDRFLMSPAGGIPVCAIILYVGFYRFVGRVGAGLLVDLMEHRLFRNLAAPLLQAWGEQYLPWAWLRDLLLAEYGVITLGLRYTFTIILPILTTFFLFFSFIEDSGYLPRAAYLINGLMEKVGLNGKAVIPLTLGLGCGTLAVLVTRTLDSRRERLQAALLLSLAVPCSAQLGLIMTLLRRPAALLIWGAVVVLCFAGAARAGRALIGPGGEPFCLEIPPLRLPRPVIILRKTAARLRWYLKEVWLIFAGISVLMWGLQYSGLLPVFIRGLEPAAASLGLPGEGALIFVYGFLRRDYGAAGLYDLSRGGVLEAGQILVAAVVLTLFLPCLAQVVMLFREYGARFTALVVGVTAALSWSAGLLVRLLVSLPWVQVWL